MKRTTQLRYWRVEVNRHEKLEIMQEWASTAIGDEQEFCKFFEITLDHLMCRFPDALIAAYRKAFPEETGEDDDDEIARQDYLFPDEED